MLPAALALALGVQCWLGLTERVINERNRMMGMAACALAICVLGAEHVTSTVEEEVGAVGEAADYQTAELRDEMPELPPPSPMLSQFASSVGVEDSAWWQPSIAAWSLWPGAGEQVSEEGARAEPPASSSAQDPPSSAPRSSSAPEPLSSTRRPSRFAPQPSSAPEPFSMPTSRMGPIAFLVHQVGTAAAHLQRSAVSLWRFTQQDGAPTNVTWEHLILLGIVLLAYTAMINARREAPSRLRAAVDEIENLNIEIRAVAERLALQNRNETPSPERLRQRRSATTRSGVRNEETAPGRMDLLHLLAAAEEPQLIWPFTAQEDRGRLTDAAKKYREVDASLNTLCRKLTTLDAIGLDNWWGRTKLYEVATDCAMACADARGGSLTHHSVDQLEELLNKHVGGLMAKLDSDGDGKITEREIQTHTSSATHMRPSESRRWQAPVALDDDEFDQGQWGIRNVCRRVYLSRRQPVDANGEPCQDWLLGVVWVLLVLLTPDEEFVHAENVCKRLAQQYQIPPAWFRRMVDIRKEQMEERAINSNHWVGRLKRRLSGSRGILVGPIVLSLITVDAFPMSGIIAAWNSVVSTVQRQMLYLVRIAKSLTVIGVLLLLFEVLHQLGLVTDWFPGCEWRRQKRKACRNWWNPPHPAFRVEEEPLVDDDEIEPQMDHAGRVLCKRFAIPTHPGWHRCVPADGSANYYVKESTGQLEWVLPKTDNQDSGDSGGGTGSVADGRPPPSAAWNMHTELSRSGHQGGRHSAWPKWLEATETAGADLTSAEAAQLSALPPSPAQLAEAEERARQRSRLSTGSDAMRGEAGRARPNLVVNRLRMSNWERMRNVVAPHEGSPREAALSADELERQEILKLAQEARKASELAHRPPQPPANAKWVPPTATLEQHEKVGLRAWLESQSRFGNSRGTGTGVGKSLDELPPPPWMMEKEEVEFRLAIERQRDELNISLATKQIELAKKKKEEREREARGAASGLLSPVRALFTPSKSPPQRARSPRASGP